jgi:phospholipase C
MRARELGLCAVLSTIALASCNDNKLEGLCTIATCLGCCDSAGTCQLGTEVTACGGAAAACQACPESQTCQHNACTGPSADAGRTDAGADAGSADAGPEDAGCFFNGCPLPEQCNIGTGACVPADAGLGHIDHLIILVLENHTLDNLFGSFPGVDGKTSFVGPDGGTFPAPACPNSLPRDLCHAHECALTSWDQGKMDGWWNVAGATQNGDLLAWCQYNGTSIPGLWDLASNYALADQFHASMLGPSFPGHTFALAAQAGWAIGNPGPDAIIWGCDSFDTLDPFKTVTYPFLEGGTCTADAGPPCFDIPSAPDVLPPGTTWKFYGTGIGVDAGVLSANFVWSMFDAIKSIRNSPAWQTNVVPYDNAMFGLGDGGFDQDIAAGKLPNVTWLVDQDLYSGHPPLSMCASVTWITEHVNKVIESPYWSSSAIIITWDDYGGFVDHVPPPVQYGCEPTTPYGQGFRLPAIIISPWVKQGIFHGVAEQASLVRLIEELFAGNGAVGALNARDPAARDLAPRDPRTRDLSLGEPQKAIVHKGVAGTVAGCARATRCVSRHSWICTYLR